MQKPYLKKNQLKTLHSLQTTRPVIDSEPSSRRFLAGSDKKHHSSFMSAVPKQNFKMKQPYSVYSNGHQSPRVKSGGIEETPAEQPSVNDDLLQMMN